MKINKFDVVELKDKTRGTILENNKNGYKAEIVNAYGISLGIKDITNNDMEKHYRK